MKKEENVPMENNIIRNMERKLILQCAPLFIKQRISAFYMAGEDELESLVRICSSMKITARALGKVGNKWGALLYHKSLLSEYLKNEDVRELLGEMGYENTELIPVLLEFAQRYRHYGIFGEGFPHEMGLILGYPADDVKGYISNKGENSLFIGCWKVYKKLPEKMRLFKEFERAKQIMIMLNLRGLSLSKIVRMLEEIPAGFL